MTMQLRLHASATLGPVQIISKIFSSPDRLQIISKITFSIQSTTTCSCIFGATWHSIFYRVRREMSTRMA